MTTLQTPESAATAQRARITVRGPDGQTFSDDVTPDDNLIVGSSSNCRIRLECSDVAAMHCLISLQNGRLSVQDWYTTAGTFLNGQKLETPSSFTPEDEIRIADFRLTAEWTDAPTANAEAPADTPSIDADADSSLDEFLAETVERLEAEASRAAGGESQTTLDEDRESARLRARVADLEQELGDLRERSWEAESAAGEMDPFDAEMVELLKSEVEQLQAEVNQRDARIAELSEVVEHGGATHNPDDDAQTAALVERLEKLVDELRSADDRAATLEDLLRSADEATQAEQEERRQLGAWVREIEERIGDREAEWKAETTTLQRRIDELSDERTRFNEKLRDLGSSQGSAQQVLVIEELREEAESLKQKLQDTEDSRRNLKETIDSVEFQTTEEGLRKKIEQLMREERLELAEEAAQIARERAEVARLKSETDNQAAAAAGRPIDEAACRVQAFRQHLKEVHNTEKPAKTEKKPTSLSARIASLWKRLDG